MLNQTDAMHVIHAKIAACITSIDQQINLQLNSILQQPQFQKLEASWRNLAYLVRVSKQWQPTVIQFLNISRQELMQDLIHAFEFDQSQLFDKVYNRGFGIAGGLPFTILIGDYEFDHSLKDIQILQAISQISTAAFSPFIAGAAAHLLGLENMAELGHRPSLHNIFHQAEYLAWQHFRQQEDSRFIALTLPHHLLRGPYSVVSPNGLFQYRASGNKHDYLWGNAAFAFAAMLMRNFSQSAWFGAIRGCPEDENSGGCAPTAVINIIESRFNSPLFVDTVITDELEKELSDLGLLPLCQQAYAGATVFYSNNSVQQVKLTHLGQADDNYRAASLLQYLLCACRFAHYLKIIARGKIGSFISATECQDYLNKWLLNYVAANSNLSTAQRARFPLQRGEISVRQASTNGNMFYCTMLITPFLQLEQLHVEFIFVTAIGHSSTAEKIL